MKPLLIALFLTAQLAVMSPTWGETSTVIDLATRPGVTQRMILVEPDGRPRAAAVLIAGGNGALRRLSLAHIEVLVVACAPTRRR